MHSIIYSVLGGNSSKDLEGGQVGANDKDLQHNRNYTRGPQLLEKHFTANGAVCSSTISGAAEAEQVIGDQADLLLAPRSFSMPSISFTTGHGRSLLAQESTTRR